jgi:hypothetical protein
MIFRNQHEINQKGHEIDGQQDLENRPAVLGDQSSQSMWFLNLDGDWLLSANGRIDY